jgi:ADP-heptose:LPS heptosyltransferase
MNILLWKIGALGDIAMTTPMVRQLRRAQPGARIDYLTGQGCAAVIGGNPHLDRIRTFDESILYRGHVARVPQLLELVRGYDCVIILDKHWIFPLLAKMAGAPMRVGFRRRRHEGALLTHRVPYGPVRHEIHYYIDLLEAAGWPVDRHDIALEAPSAPGPDAGVPPSGIVLVNSGGTNANERSNIRRMPDDLFASLVAACVRQAPVVFVGSGAEAPYYARFATPECTNLCGRTDLPGAVSVLRRAARVITTDTGLMHLAGAVHSDVTAVFGPTHPQRKCPPGARWVWGDEDQYDPDYEVLGKLPRGAWFRSLSPEQVLQAPPSPPPQV